MRDTGSTATTFAHNIDLEPSTYYRYQVAAINSVGARPVVERGPGLHACRQTRGADRAHGPGGRHVADRPVVECAPQHRRSPDPRLPDRGLEQRGPNLEHHPPRHAFGGDDILRRGPRTRDHAALSRRRDQHRGERAVLQRRAGDHRRDPSGRAPRPHRGGGRHLGDRPLLAGAQRRWRRAGHRLP